MTVRRVVEMFLASFVAIFTGFTLSFRHTYMQIMAGFCFRFIWYKQSNGYIMALIFHYKFIPDIVRNYTTVCLSGHYSTHYIWKVCLKYIVHVSSSPTSIHCYESDWNHLAAILKPLVLPIQRVTLHFSVYKTDGYFLYGVY